MPVAPKRRKLGSARYLLGLCVIKFEILDGVSQHWQIRPKKVSREKGYSKFKKRDHIFNIFYSLENEPNKV